MRYSDYAEELSQQLIKMVEREQAPWQKGFNISGFEPESYATEKPYNGYNAIRLILTSVERGYEDNRWITAKQAAKEGGKPTGKGVPILFATDERLVKEKDEETGEETYKKVKLAKPVIKKATVYNISQIEGMEVKELKTPQDLGWKQADLLNNIREKTKAEVVHAGTPAYYPGLDKIGMPPPEAYNDERRYASSLIHETSHWTGNEQRLGRNFGAAGTTAYAREELVAEISTMLISGKTGIDTFIENNESYIASWWEQAKEHLEKNPTDIMKICKDAYATREYILEGRELERLDQESIIHKVELTDQEKESGRINLDLPYSEKNAGKKLAKNLGVDLKWDKQGKTWYANVEEGQNIGDLAKFRVTDNVNNTEDIAKEQNGELQKQEDMKQRFDYNISYTKKDAAKEIAKDHNIKLRFDGSNKVWHTTATKEDHEKFTHTLLEAGIIKGENKPVGFAVLDPISGEIVASKTELKDLYKVIDGLEKNEAFKKIEAPIYEIIKGDNGKNKLGQKIETENKNIAEPASTNQNRIDKEESQKVYLDVPYHRKDEVKAIAKNDGVPLKFDGEFKAWYVKKEDLIPSLKSFVPETTQSQKMDVGSFEDELSKLGAANSKITPELDGKWHRVKSGDDSQGKASISYKGYNNGVPNALIINHKTGERSKWIGKSTELSKEDKQVLRIVNRNNQEAAKAKMNTIRNQAAHVAKDEIKAAKKADEKHPYLINKGIQPHGLKEDEKGNLLVQLTNANGEIRSFQRIDKKGQKGYLKGGEKSGNFHAFGKPTNGKPIIITEGIATAATIHEVMGSATVAALDSGNLTPVAKALVEKYPDSPIVIAADNDHKLTINNVPKNIGIIKGKEAAAAVGGTVISPKIDLKDPTSDMITDYNDVAKYKGKQSVANELKKVFDKESVKRQIRDLKTENKKPNSAISNRKIRKEQQDNGR